MNINLEKLALIGVKVSLVSMLASCGSGSDTRSAASVNANGNWSLVTTSSNQFDTAGGVCLSGAGTLIVSNQSLSGSFAGSGASNEVTGTIDSEGVVIGQFNRDGQTIGNVLGSFSNLSGSGTWADIFGCGGDWTATR